MKSKTLQPGERSHGAVLLARTGRTQEDVATICDVSRSLASHWISGRRKPSPENRAILDRELKIAPHTFDEAPPALEKPKRRGKAPPAEAVAAISVRARATALDQMVHQLMADVAKGEPALRARVAQSAARTLEILGKITGETREMPEERVLRLPAWRKIQDRLVEVLSPFPEALRAVGEALVELGAEK